MQASMDIRGSPQPVQGIPVERMVGSLAAAVRSLHLIRLMHEPERLT